jgi:hypothetical protein
VYVFFWGFFAEVLNAGALVTIVGLVFGAERALFEHENKKRREENIIRREARLDLARKGLIGTETEIANWKAEKELERSKYSS